MLEKSPWLTIWVRPRETIRKIVSENPNRGLWVFATFYGFSSLLNLFQKFSFGMIMEILPIFLLALVLSPFWGYAIFTIWSLVVFWTGRWLKGQGSFRTVRAAYSWSCVPLVISAFLWVVMIFLFGKSLFINDQVEPIISNALIFGLFAILFAKVVFAVWSFVIYLNALAEVQKFSVFRAIGNVVITCILFSIVISILYYI